MAVYSLLHSPYPHGSHLLGGTILFGARTFLSNNFEQSPNQLIL